MPLPATTRGCRVLELQAFREKLRAFLGVQGAALAQFGQAARAEFLHVERDRQVALPHRHDLLRRADVGVVHDPSTKIEPETAGCFARRPALQAPPDNVTPCGQAAWCPGCVRTSAAARTQETAL